MNRHWIEVRLTVPAAAVDLVSSELADLGSEGITVEERALDTFIAPDPDQVFDPEPCISAYFPAPAEEQALLKAIDERLAALAPLFPQLRSASPAISRVRNEDWAENWKQHFTPQRIGSRLVVQPTWETAPTAPGDVVVELDPGMAFGTGTHGTTRLCLEALAELFEAPQVPQRVLDVGTGSGILAIAAAALGARRVLACDIEDEAARTTRHNARHNGVDAQVEVTLAPLEDLEGGFEVVVANILAEENVRLAAQLFERLLPGGTLILSGILREKEALVREGFAPFGLKGPRVDYEDEWVCLVYRRES